MDDLLEQLQASFPKLRFRIGRTFCWSPETHEILYPTDDLKPTASWSLLHETSHALLGHRNYGPDYELLALEMAAWERAKELGEQFDVTIDEEHIQDCLDSYRDWIYARSICPRCATKSLQQDDLRHYRCFNCHETWQVTPSRFCRVYRATKRATARAIEPFDALDTI